MGGGSCIGERCFFPMSLFLVLRFSAFDFFDFCVVFRAEWWKGCPIDSKKNVYVGFAFSGEGIHGLLACFCLSISF